MNHKNHSTNKHSEHSNHEHMVTYYKKRFWVALIFTVLILILSTMIQRFLGLGEKLRFPDALTTVIVAINARFLKVEK